MSPNFKEILDKHLDSICKRVGADALGVYDRDAKAEVARLLAWAGDKPREEAPFDVPPIGTCAKTGKGLLIEKKHEEKKDERDEKYRSLIVVPILGDQKQLGVLSGASTKSEFFKQEEQLKNIRALAEWLAQKWVETPEITLH